jgi:hypothetical protein
MVAATASSNDITQGASTVKCKSDDNSGSSANVSLASRKMRSVNPSSAAAAVADTVADTGAIIVADGITAALDVAVAVIVIFFSKTRIVAKVRKKTFSSIAAANNFMHDSLVFFSYRCA